MAKKNTTLTNIVAIDGNAGSTCPLVTFEFRPRKIGAPTHVTLSICEWQRVAQQIVDAGRVLRG